MIPLKLPKKILLKHQKKIPKMIPLKHPKMIPLKRRKSFFPAQNFHQFVI
jgi:hypothetical protein